MSSGAESKLPEPGSVSGRRLRQRLRELASAQWGDSDEVAPRARADFERTERVRTVDAIALSHDGELWRSTEALEWPNLASGYAEISIGAGVTPDVGARARVYLDLETLGLAREHAIFMAGYLMPEPTRVVLLQEVAADPGEEFHLLARARALLETRPQVITYNGRSFDLKALARRLQYHGLDPLPANTEIVDLLHALRRRYRKRFPDYRLATLERELLGCRRGASDVPGKEAPLRFRDFQDTGRLEHLAPVLYHNRMDLVAMALLKAHLDSVADAAAPLATESARSGA